MSSRGRLKEFASKARSLEKDDPSVAHNDDVIGMSRDQDGVTASTPLMNSATEELNNDSFRPTKTETAPMPNNRGPYLVETPNLSGSHNFLDQDSLHKSRDNMNSKDNLLSANQSPEEDPHYSIRQGHPPPYSQLNCARLASFDNFDEATLKTSPSTDADLQFGSEASLTRKTTLDLPDTQADGATNHSLKEPGSNLVTPMDKFYTAATAVQAIVRLSRLERAKRRAKWAGKKLLVFLLSHIGLILLVLVYSTAGGLLFRWLELEAELSRIRSMDQIRAKYLSRMWNETARQNVLHPANWTRDMKVILKDYERVLQHIISDGEWDEAVDKAKWSIPGSILFSTTVVTSIGYGDLTPKTTAGKLVCIPFAIIGIPLTLICLANIGQLLASCCRFAWRRFTQCVHIITVPIEKRRKTDNKKEKTRVPITVSLFIMLAYILLGAILFSHWEAGWSFLDGFYFCFITLSTIGFGDFVPGQYETGSNARQVVCTLYLLVGLALLSTVFQLMIDSVMGIVEAYARFFGLSKEQIKEEIQGIDETTVQTQLVGTQNSELSTIVVCQDDSKNVLCKDDSKNVQDFNGDIQSGEPVDVQLHCGEEKKEDWQGIDPVKTELHGGGDDDINDMTGCGESNKQSYGNGKDGQEDKEKEIADPLRDS